MKHTCNDNGIPIVMLSNGESMKETEYNKLSDSQKEDLKIVGGSVTCSICGSSSMGRMKTLGLMNELP